VNTDCLVFLDQGKIGVGSCFKAGEDTMWHLHDLPCIGMALAVILVTLVHGNLLDRDSQVWRTLTAPARLRHNVRRLERSCRRWMRTTAPALGHWGANLSSLTVVSGSEPIAELPKQSVS
jgi:hypothetical protein